jgi:hypothetical protein
LKRSIKIVAVSRTLSPLTHMQGSEGNRGVVMREPVLTSGGVRLVPCLSGNALRHRLIRRPAMLDLIERWGLSGELSVAQLNFLLHGGSLTEKGGRVSIADQQDLYRIFPVLRLLGCSLPGQIVPGCLQVWRGMLVCRENVPRLRRILSGEWHCPANLRPAVTQFQDWLYTRSEAAKSAPDVAVVDGDADTASNLMMFEGQAVAAGAVFVHGYTITGATKVERGALYRALSLWRDVHGGTIGGQSARGHGRLDTLYVLPEDEDTHGLSVEYQAYSDAGREEAVQFLHRVFRRLPAEEPADEDGEAEAEEPAEEPAAKKPRKRKGKELFDETDA